MNTLRKQAEERLLHEQSEDVSLSSPEEIQRVLHELRVHQIELQIQNEELHISQQQLQESHQQLQESRTRYRDLYDCAPVGYLTIDSQGLIAQANLTYANMVGIERASLLARSPAHWIANGDRDAYHVYFRTILKTQMPQSCELSLQRTDGTQCFAHLDGVPVLDAAEHMRHVRMTVTDIAMRKRAEDQLNTALKEKETLLRELYHRTKNNMAVISAMLSLQADQLDDARMRRIFQDMENRIKSMALVHQHLYQTDNLSRIDLHDYVHSLTQLLVESYTVQAGHISLVFDLERVSVLIDTAIPCGLILNELISNALKHAFPGERRGEIRIQLHRMASGDIELQVADNGVGVPQDLDVRNTQTFGLQSLFLLGELQLQGTVTCDLNTGFACCVRFHDTFYQERV